MDEENALTKRIDQASTSKCTIRTSVMRPVLRVVHSVYFHMSVFGSKSSLLKYRANQEPLHVAEDDLQFFPI